MKRTKRYLSGLLAVLMLIGSIDMGGAIDVNRERNSDETEINEEKNKENNSDVSFRKVNNGINALVDEGTDTEQSEETSDNWELSLVFYDSSVNNGKTSLTNINWDASEVIWKVKLE